MSDDDMPPPLCSNEKENSDDEDDNDWEEMEEVDEKCLCLFCEVTASNVEQSILHLVENHKFDLSIMKDKFQMDQYSYIMLINYIRQHKCTPESLTTASRVFWNDEQYLKPVREEDSGWFCFDFESLPSSKIVEVVENEDDSVMKIHQLELQVAALKQQVKEKDVIIEYATNDIETMRKSFINLIEKEDVKQTKSKLDENSVGGRDGECDEGYFWSYAHFGIHFSMLSDFVRTDSYRNAICNNPEVLKGKIVIDCGCGTSILSMFASQAGAKEIIAIDQSDIIYQAMDIARLNNISNIKFIKGRLEDTKLPVEKVDIIISEWMGYFLLFEGMLDSVIYARDMYLKPGGIIMPNRCTINFAAYGDEAGHDGYIKFWNNVYGFDFSCMKKDVLKEAVIEVVREEFVMTESNIVLNVDLMTATTNCPNFSYDFSLEVKKAGKITSFLGYFDTFFDLPNPVSFSTSPDSTPTHWKQILFYLDEPREIKVGDIISGKFFCRRDRKDVRSLIISIEVFGEVLKYCLN